MRLQTNPGRRLPSMHLFVLVDNINPKKKKQKKKKKKTKERKKQRQSQERLNLSH